MYFPQENHGMRNWLVSLLLLTIFHIKSESVSIVSAKDIDTLESLIPHSFILSKLTYTSDVFFDPQEFAYLVDMKEGRTYTFLAIKRALSYLLLKQKFKTITVSIGSDSDGISLHFAFEFHWILTKVKISGIWVGKEWYRQYYLMEPGDIFDIDKHNHSIEKIKDQAIADGFLI